jgi:Flagellar hook-length control protein FliK
MISPSASMPSTVADTSGFSSASNLPGAPEESAPMEFDQMLSGGSKGSPGQPPSGAPMNNAGAPAGQSSALNGQAASTTPPPTGPALPLGFIRSMAAAASRAGDGIPVGVTVPKASPSAPSHNPPAIPTSMESASLAAGAVDLETGEVTATPEATAAAALPFSAPGGALHAMRGTQSANPDSAAIATTGSDAQNEEPAAPVSAWQFKTLKFTGNPPACKKAVSKAGPAAADQGTAASMMVQQPVLPPQPPLGNVPPVSGAALDSQSSSVELSAAAPSAAGSSAGALPTGIPPAGLPVTGQTAGVVNNDSTGEESAGKDLPSPAVNPGFQNLKTAGNPHGSLIPSSSVPSPSDAGTPIAKPDPTMSALAQNPASAQSPAASAGAPSAFSLAGAGGSLTQGPGVQLDSRWIASAAATQSQASAVAGGAGISVARRGGRIGDAKTPSSQDFSAPTSTASEQAPDSAPAVSAGAMAQGFGSSPNGGNGGASGNPAKAANPGIESTFPISIAPPAGNAAVNSCATETAAPAALPASVLAGLNNGLEQIRQHGDSRVDLRLPLEGGSHVDIQLRLQDGAVHASLITASPELREALRQQWSQLASSSNSMGLRLAEPAFESAPQTGSGFAQQQSHRQQQGSTSDDSAPTAPSSRPSLKSAPGQSNTVQPTPTALTTWA